MLDPEYLQTILSSPVCKCGSDCSAFWSRELWMNLHEPILDFAKNRQMYMRFMRTLIAANCYNAQNRTFHFVISGKFKLKSRNYFLQVGKFVKLPSVFFGI
jgi:hypothetical protein